MYTSIAELHQYNQENATISLYHFPLGRGWSLRTRPYLGVANQSLLVCNQLEKGWGGGVVGVWKEQAGIPSYSKFEGFAFCMAEFFKLLLATTIIIISICCISCQWVYIGPTRKSCRGWPGLNCTASFTHVHLWHTTSSLCQPGRTHNGLVRGR